ncbi:hypothetical protein KR038_004194, partial [Drosophila bunnanda]
VHLQEPPVDSTAKSAVNLALAQAAETYRKSQEAGISQSLRDEMRAGFLKKMQLINEVLRPSTKPQHQQPPPFGRSREAVYDARGAIPKQGQTAAGQATRPTPRVPPKPLRRAADPDESFSNSPDISTETEETRRDDCAGRNWRVEDSRAGDFRDERMYVNWNAGDSSYGTRVDWWNFSFSGEDERNHIEGFLFRLEYLQRQSRCSWAEVMRNFHTLLTGRALEWFWIHVQQHRLDSWHQLRRALIDRFQSHETE